MIKQHLDNNSTYKLLENDHLSIVINNINSELVKLKLNKCISIRVFNKLFIKKACKSGTIRILPKLHKKKFGLRPIINCINHPTSKLCEIIDIIFKKVLINCNTILKDSQEFLQICKNKKFNSEKIFLYSCDFESLYTNIEPNHAINIICDFLKDSSIFIDNFDFNLISLHKILYIIFKSGIFQFENLNYLQIKGLPMGCKCGPSVANLFLFILERKWVSLHPEVLYKRFIDDIIIISLIELNIQDLISQFLYLKLNIEKNNTVIFLDLRITFDKILKKLFFDLYIKPTNSCSYLMPISNHPSHIFENIPISLFTRIRRICSSYLDYLNHSRDLVIQLIKQGYNLDKILGICRSIGNKSRDELLPYKNKTLVDNSKIKLFINYDNNVKFLNQIVGNSYREIKKDCEFLKLYYL